jgi:hypothetical protein
MVWEWYVEFWRVDIEEMRIVGRTVAFKRIHRA